MLLFSGLQRGFKLGDRPLPSIRALVSSPAGVTLACTAIIWLSIFAACKHLLWRDPHTAFFSEDGAYDLDYSSFRQAEAHEYIAQAEEGAHNRTEISTTGTPSICAAITTFNRNGRQYLNETVGSMLAGLTDEERNELDVQLLFAHVNSTVHPDWGAKWLDTLDQWGTYNVSEEDLGQVQEWETAQNFYAKGV
jgi:hypothetical protein